MKDTNMTPAQIEARQEKKSDRRHKANVILWLIIFIAGIIVGIWGLCATVKFVFYLGLAVVILGFIALLYCLVRLGFKRRKYYTGDDDCPHGSVRRF